MSLRNILEPFWNNLSRFFLYPFQLTPFLLILGLSILGACFPESTMARIFVAVVMMKYSFAALQWTAQGSMKAVPLDFQLINDNVELVLKQFMILVAIGFGAGTVGAAFGILGAYLFYSAAMIVLPAMIMLLVATDSLINALNPLMVFKLIFRIGWAYLLLYLFLFFLYGGPAVLFSYLPLEIFPDRVIFFIVLFLQQLYALIGYNLMGYVLLQYHKEIGYHVDYEFFMENSGRKRKVGPEDLFDEIRKGVAVLSKVGNYSQALKLIRPHILDGSADLDLSEKFYMLLSMAGEPEKAANYAPRHLDALVEGGKKQKSLKLFAEMTLTQTRLPKLKSLMSVAHWYKQTGEFRRSGQVLAQATKFFKNDPLLPDVYLELAKLLHEHLNDSVKARQILKIVIKKYPDHESIPEAKKILRLAA